MPRVSWYLYSGWSVTPKIDAWASAPVPHPHVVTLQSLEWREVGLKLSWLVISFRPHQCDQHLCHQNANVDFYTPLFLYIDLFTLYLAKKLWKMSAWKHGVSCSPTPEESHLFDAGSAMDNSHFVVLPQFHSPLEFVPLGWCWCTWPT